MCNQSSFQVQVLNSYTRYKNTVSSKQIGTSYVDTVTSGIVTLIVLTVTAAITK